MAVDWCYCICVIFMLCVIVGGSIASVLLFFLIDTSLSWPTEKWEYKDMAIVCDAKECAEVAKAILMNKGTIGDAAVAALLCMGVTAPHLSGIGGGLVAVFYNSSTHEVSALDAIGHAPLATKSDMFNGAKADLASSGSLAPIVPGALSGYKLLHSKLGKLQWGSLFVPAINLAEKGFAIGPHLADAVLRNSHILEKNKTTKETFYNRGTDQWLQVNEKLVQPQLAETLRRIASSKGADIFYSGKIAREMTRTFKNEPWAASTRRII